MIQRGVHMLQNDIDDQRTHRTTSSGGEGFNLLAVAGGEARVRKPPRHQKSAPNNQIASTTHAVNATEANMTSIVLPKDLAQE